MRFEKPLKKVYSESQFLLGLFYNIKELLEVKTFDQNQILRQVP
jgi:hypothetical protein